MICDAMAEIKTQNFKLPAGCITRMVDCNASKESKGRAILEIKWTRTLRERQNWLRIVILDSLKGAEVTANGYLRTPGPSLPRKQRPLVALHFLVKGL